MVHFILFLVERGVTGCACLRDGYLFRFIPSLFRYLFFFFPTPIRSLQLPIANRNLPFSNRRRQVQVFGRSDRILHETWPFDKGESKERRWEALLWFLQNPQQPRCHRWTPPLLEPLRHRSCPRWAWRGSSSTLFLVEFVELMNLLYLFAFRLC